MQYSVRTHDRLLDLSSPRVMAIINITPDSFYTSCQTLSEKEVLSAAEKAIADGADILDLGACSTRPNSTPVEEAEEWCRLAPALRAIRHHWKDAIISVDTFRADVADKALAAGADIINDVYGGEAEPAIWDVVSKYHAPYILTHSSVIPIDEEYDHTLSTVVGDLQRKLDTLHRRGIADVIIDPGFGFGKTLEQNYRLLQDLRVFECLHAPILVGVSRKSMLYKPLDSSPDQVLPATTAAHTIALERGANILRVHDVAAAKQTICIHQLTHNS